MSYEHDIFLSYARGSWTDYVRHKFLPRLEALLEAEVGSLNISVDYQIQPGAEWEPNFKRRVARSRIMMSLLTAHYFQRDWCRREMALMMERERYLGLEGRGENYGLLIPVRLGGGSTFPERVGQVQWHDFEEFADPDLPAGSERASKANSSLRKLAQAVGRTLLNVRDWRIAWQDFSGDDFFLRLCPKTPVPRPEPPRLLV
jgi:hypothetical protein